MLFSIAYQWTCFIWMVERSLSNDSMLPLWVLNTVKINLYLVYKLMLDLLLLQGFDSNILAINSFLHLIAECLSVQSSATIQTKTLKWCLTSTVSIFNVYMVTVCCRCLNKLPATQIITLHQSEMSSQLISSWVAVFFVSILHTSHAFLGSFKTRQFKMHFHILNETPQISYSQICSGDNSTLFFLQAVPNTEHRFSLQVEIKLQSYVGCKIPMHSSKQSIW